ncbi:hypothetical protein BGW42_005771 [Actinomortierella wolfii]|nr:hypothetical protein BGW42_005771 [Actinomortierella wolfii]
MSAPVKTTYFFRTLVVLTSGAVLAGSIFMQVTFLRHLDVIFRWKFSLEFLLGGLTFLGYLFSFLFRRFHRPRSVIASVIFTFLGLLWAAAWLYTTVTIIALQERQVLSIPPSSSSSSLEAPPRHRQRGSWDFWNWVWDYPNVTNQEDLFKCSTVPISPSMGESLSRALCHVDQATVCTGAACGLLILIDVFLSLLCEQMKRHQRRRDEECLEKPLPEVVEEQKSLTEQQQQQQQL